jgi:hypothetical protein
MSAWICEGKLVDNSDSSHGLDGGNNISVAHEKGEVPNRHPTSRQYKSEKFFGSLFFNKGSYYFKPPAPVTS